MGWLGCVCWLVVWVSWLDVVFGVLGCVSVVVVCFRVCVFFSSGCSRCCCEILGRWLVVGLLV